MDDRQEYESPSDFQPGAESGQSADAVVVSGDRPAGAAPYDPGEATTAVPAEEDGSLSAEPGSRAADASFSTTLGASVAGMVGGMPGAALGSAASDAATDDLGESDRA